MATSRIAIDGVPARRSANGVVVLGAMALAVVAIVLGVVGIGDHNDPLGRSLVAVVAAWALVSVFLAWVRSSEPMWAWCGLGAVVGGLALVDNRAAGLVPYAVFAFATLLPSGTLTTRAARMWLVIGTVVALPFVVVLASRSGNSATRVAAAESVVLGLAAVGAYVQRCRRASAVDRARLQWVGWGVVVASACILATGLMHELVGWPSVIGPTMVWLTLFVPVAVALSAIERLALRVDRLLVRTIEAGGLVLMVGTIYLVVVLGFGESPDASGRRVLGLSMIAAAISALLYLPARARLDEFANRRVYGERRAPDEPLQTFGARMSRAIPLDELLLQLAESLHKSMQLTATEVWTGANGRLDRAAAVPYRQPATLRLAPEEVQVIARAHVSGNAWMQVWLPGMLEHFRDRIVRVAPMTHSGELLGLIVCARRPDDQPFSDEEERMLTELARQVALALHNSALDTALQASLDELQVANEELRASRARIVAAADQSRRQIERNLHDGAQQHLVALAVKLGLARQLIDADPSAVATLLEELRGDAQATLTELRELAHGIYPPLLMDRGLAEALRAAANRSILPTDVHAEVGRFPPDIEAAVYFCCLEAMQNAGKHAGEGARLTITVDVCDDELCFEVSDDGAGFDVDSSAIRGHGFVNMVDRVGAIGGTLQVESEPGKGTRVRGRIPLEHEPAPTPA
jgi:signal transduction histidine kinase